MQLAPIPEHEAGEQLQDLLHPDHIQEEEVAIQSGASEGTGRTTLAKVLDGIDDLDEDLTIYTSYQPKCDQDSAAVVCFEPDDGSLPEEATGLKYLLEVHVAKAVIRVWRTWRKNAAPTSKEKCDAVIYYATNDSYLPV